MVKQDKSVNPFMAGQTKSLNLSPNPGVCVKESASDRVSLRNSGGVYKPSDTSRLSRQDFQSLQSLSALKPKVTEQRKPFHSIDVTDMTDSHISTLFAPTPSVFTTAQAYHSKFDRIKLPSLNKNVDELLLSPSDIRVINTNAKAPSPGAYHVAQSRAFFSPPSRKILSVRKGPLYQSVEIGKRDSLLQESSIQDG